MKKTIAFTTGLFLLMSPFLVSAQSTAALAQPSNIYDARIALYTEIIQLLRQEIALLEGQQPAPSLNASPTTGAIPLTVQFTATAPQGATLGSTMNFGDGTSGTLLAVPVCSNCNQEGSVSHTYTSAGTYTATLTTNNCSCPANGICNCPNMSILGSATVTVFGTTTASTIKQLNAPGSVALAQGDIAEIRNKSSYFTLENLTASTATIDITPVGCWNSFPSDTPPSIRCMIAVVPTPPQTLSIGQSFTSANYSITLTGIANGQSVFSVTTSSI